MDTVKKASLLISALLVAGCSLAQSPAKQQTTSLLVNVNVLDRNGYVVRDLTKDNFRVKMNGRPITPLDAHFSLAPRRIVALLDMSGSMRGIMDDKKWVVAREALEDLLEETPVDTQIALLTFSDQIHDAFDFSRGRAAITAQLKQDPGRPGTKVHGKTALLDAIVAAVKLLEPSRTGDAIYAITDGGDNSSHTSETAARELLSDSGIRLFLFLLPAEPPVTEEEQEGKSSVLQLVRATGGSVFEAPGYQDLRGALVYPPKFKYRYDRRTREGIKLCARELYTLISGFYSLSLEVSLQSGKLGKLSLVVVDESSRPRKDLTLIYPTTKFPHN